MINLQDNGRVSAEDIYAYISVKTPFHKWLKRCIETADLQEHKDFWTNLSESTGGRPKTEYNFTLDAAKELCLISNTPKAKELRRWLIGLSNQRESLELITVKEAAFAFKVINCLKFIDNQREAYTMHQATFVKDNRENISPTLIYSEFAKYRAKITGWDKSRTDKAISEYLDNHAGFNRNSVSRLNMSEKLSIMDTGEAIRVAVLDILYSNHTESNMAEHFSNLCKRLANEMQVQAQRTNESDLFRDKENITEVKGLLTN